MSKINIKNSNQNSLISFLKENSIAFDSQKVSQDSEKITFNLNSPELKNTAMDRLRSYGTKLYHDTTLLVEGTITNKFNYHSSQYENMIFDLFEKELPNYYVENINEQNSRFSGLKSLKAASVSRNYIESIFYSQDSLTEKTEEQINLMKNIFLADSFNDQRSHSNLDSFCYYNKILISSYEGNKFMKTAFKELNILEEVFDTLISLQSPLPTEFLLNNQEQVSVPTFNIVERLSRTNMTIDESGKLILSDKKPNTNYMTNNFNKFLLEEFLSGNFNRFNKTLQQMRDNEECEKEFLIYKIEKFRETETSPIQSFWMYEKDIKEYIDYQIKMDYSYKYVVKCYCVIYGTSTRVSNVEEDNGKISFILTASPSVRMVVLDFYEDSIKVAPNILPPPFVKFLNESNSKNYVKIYLDLKNESRKDELLEITQTDSVLFDSLQKDQDGKTLFEYYIQNGKFEVFRKKEKPTSYKDFENSKILDVTNNNNSTSVVFKDYVFPNTKYYYMFRALNSVSMPSNPTKIFEVELIKDASKSKVISRVLEMKQELFHHDKKFKDLIQITPAFQQQVFDDLTGELLDLPSYKNKINDLTLGIATDKVWGKKFKIRLKSKDTGKIIDLNVKFNLVKDNTN